MIQISTPAQALSLSSEGSSLKETAGVTVGGENQDNAVEKKAKSGTFAKLLEGLTTKIKKDRDLSDVTDVDSGLAGLFQGDVLTDSELDTSKDLMGLLNPEETDKTTLFNGQGTKKPAHLELFNKNGPSEGLQSAGLSAGLGQDLPLAEQGLSDEILTLKDGNSLTERNLLNAAKLAKEGVSDLSNDKAGGFGAEVDQSLAQGMAQGMAQGQAELLKGEEALAASKNRSERVGAEAREGNPGKKAGRNGRGTADFQSASGRETEAGLHLARQQGSHLLRGGEQENSRLSEARGKKGRERLNSALPIEVRDLRTGSEVQAASQDASKGLSFHAAKPASAEIEIPVHLRLTGGDLAETAGGKNYGESSISKGFEDALARELRGNLSTDIVRDAMVIVRNGGEGTIRLSLHPASLGDVKIRLEMAENKITGHIIVESKEALRAFERELPVLEKAFRDSGFSETNLEMSLAQDSWDFNGREQEQEGDFRFLSPVFAASRYEAESEWIDYQDSAGTVFSASTGRTSVNLFI